MSDHLIVNAASVTKTATFSTTPHVDGYTFDDALGTSVTSYRNGATNGTGNLSGPALSSQTFTFGAYADASADLIGNIPEFVIFKTALDASERARVESYLAIKYGITLTSGASSGNYVDSDGTIIWEGQTAGADVTYANDVIAIGRDDAQGLEQIKSKVASSGTSTFYLFADSEGTANGDATFVDLDVDKEFLVTGRDSGSISTWGTSGTGRHRSGG